MIILGIELREYSSAALMVNGTIVAAVAEERFTREKGFSGFPIHSVNYCLTCAGISVTDIDLVAIPELAVSLNGIDYSLIQRRSSFSVDDYVREAHEYWYPRLYEKRDVDYLYVFRDKISNQAYGGAFLEHYMKMRGQIARDDLKEIQKLKSIIIRNFLPEIKDSQIVFLPHHDCHAFYGFWGSPYSGNNTSSVDNTPTLTVTADSWGDFENATITQFSPTGYQLLHTSNPHNFGRLFRNITLLLGLKPYEHEYKVMGLAPYAPSYLTDMAYEVFNETVDVDGLDFSYKKQPRDHYFYFQKRLEGKRFDGIAGGLQKFYEEKMQAWFANIIDHYGVKRICFSGGLANNIKCNMVLSGLPEMEAFFVPPSPDDHSNCIGACYLAMYRALGDPKESFQLMQPFSSAYLGPDVDMGETEEAMKEARLHEFCQVTETTSAEFIAAKIFEGKIIGRCSGRMEFGARALGNRSILADPRDVMVVNRINRIIKKRDFWMPFAPVIIDEDWSKYLKENGKVYSPYMTVGFETNPIAQKEIPAAIHMSDFTTRPQMLRRESNPFYYDVIKNFKKLSGVGVLLNTSFNLHGYPIVQTAEDAIGVFLRSDLDALLLADRFYIEKIRD